VVVRECGHGSFSPGGSGDRLAAAIRSLMANRSIFAAHAITARMISAAGPSRVKPSATVTSSAPAWRSSEGPVQGGPGGRANAASSAHGPATRAAGDTRRRKVSGVVVSKVLDSIATSRGYPRAADVSTALVEVSMLRVSGR